MNKSIKYLALAGSIFVLTLTGCGQGDNGASAGLQMDSVSLTRDYDVPVGKAASGDVEKDLQEIATTFETLEGLGESSDVMSGFSLNTEAGKQSFSMVLGKAPAVTGLNGLSKTVAMTYGPYYECEENGHIEICGSVDGDNYTYDTTAFYEADGVTPFNMEAAANKTSGSLGFYMYASMAESDAYSESYFKLGAAMSISDLARFGESEDMSELLSLMESEMDMNGYVYDKESDMVMEIEKAHIKMGKSGYMMDAQYLFMNEYTITLGMSMPFADYVAMFDYYGDVDLESMNVTGTITNGSGAVVGTLQLGADGTYEFYDAEGNVIGEEDLT